MFHLYALKYCDYDGFIEAIFSRITFQKITCFLNWMLCKNYKDEQKGKYFNDLKVFNALYLVLTVLCITFWFIALVVTRLRFFVSILVFCRIAIVDLILICYIAIVGIFRRHDNN